MQPQRSKPFGPDLEVFDNPQDANAKLIRYWISHPAPAGQDEFSAAGNSLFTPPDPNTGSCNTQ